MVNHVFVHFLTTRLSYDCKQLGMQQYGSTPYCVLNFSVLQYVTGFDKWLFLYGNCSTEKGNEETKKNNVLYFKFLLAV